MNTKTVKKRYIILGAVLTVLALARIMLPYLVIKYVNKVLSEIPGYVGSIDDIDIRLFRGAYIIDELKIFRVEGHQKIPFIDIPKTDISLEWEAVFKGALVGEIEFKDPVLNFVLSHNIDSTMVSTSQTGSDVDWSILIKKLLPIKINHFEVVNGSIFFYDFSTDPKVDLHLKDLTLDATNLNNAEQNSIPLPSHITATATSIGEGKLYMTMDINVLKEIPDLDMDLTFESIDMPTLNDFFMAYSSLDVEKGTFNLYLEMTIVNGHLSGYLKPLAQNIRIFSWKEDKQRPLNLIWQGIAGLFVELFENQKKDQFATKVPMQGDLKNIETKVWPTIWNVFQNAFVHAFEMKIDGSVEFESRPKPESRKDERQREKAEKRSK